MSPLRTKGDIYFFFRFCFSAKLVRTITCLSFEIGQWYLICGCMSIRRFVVYRNDLRGTMTFDLKVKVPSRSLWYKTHMHPHTKYHWPISKETIIWPWGQRSRSHEDHYVTWHTTLWLCTHIPNIIDLPRKTKMLWPGQENTIQKTIIWPWGQSPTKVTITFLSFEIGQWYFVCGCMTIRWCVAYCNDLRGTLTFDLQVK
jgi:hypothetical protein